MKLHDRLIQIDKEVDFLHRERQNIVQEIQDACSHPGQYVCKTGYDSPDGYGGSDWVNTGSECELCNKKFPITEEL